VLIHYENFLGWQGKEPEFVYKERTGIPPGQVGVIYRSAELLVSPWEEDNAEFNNGTNR
jgi:hypothetical protein